MNNKTTNRVPAYLDTPTYCKIVTPFAIGISSQVLLTICYLWINLPTIIAETTFGSQLIFIIELAFMITCTGALWKRALRK